jgi:hypothetical protein
MLVGDFFAGTPLGSAAHSTALLYARRIMTTENNPDQSVNRVNTGNARV